MKKIGLCILTVAVLFLAACSHSGGDGTKYLGSWVNTKNPTNTVVIEKNGDDYSIRENSADPMFGKITSNTTPAAMKDGTLQTQTDFAPVPYAIDATSGNLVVGDREYKRAK